MSKLKDKEKRSPENRKQNRKKGLPKEAEPFKFKPGQSGNPGGRPKKTPLTDLYRELVDDPEVLDEIRNSVRQMVKSGRMVGMLQLKEMAERVEGKVKQQIEAEVTVNLADAIAAARKRAGK
jgi:hypothetical protein